MTIQKLIHGNCIEHMATMENESVDLVVTDPPYLIEYKTGRRKDKNHKFCSTIAGDDDPELITQYIKECFRIMKPDTAMYMFCNDKQIDFFKQELEEVFGDIKSIIVWVKNNHTAGDLQYAFAPKYEFIILVNKGSKPINGKRFTNVWFFDKIVGDKQLHQNQKPVNLIERCIHAHSKQGDIVFDGFAGSGSTALAARNLNRGYITVEINDENFKIASERLTSDTTSVLGW